MRESGVNKCVKVLLNKVSDLAILTGAIKKSVLFEGVEGLVEEVIPDTLEIVLYGPKELVDSAVIELELFVAKKSVQQKKQIGFAVEPFAKKEDYRGVVRFIKKRS